MWIPTKQLHVPNIHPCSVDVVLSGGCNYHVHVYCTLVCVADIQLLVTVLLQGKDYQPDICKNYIKMGCCGFRAPHPQLASPPHPCYRELEGLLKSSYLPHSLTAFWTAIMDCREWWSVWTPWRVRAFGVYQATTLHKVLDTHLQWLVITHRACVSLYLTIEYTATHWCEIWLSLRYKNNKPSTIYNFALT